MGGFFVECGVRNVKDARNGKDGYLLRRFFS